MKTLLTKATALGFKSKLFLSDEEIEKEASNITFSTSFIDDSADDINSRKLSSVFGLKQYRDQIPEHFLLYEMKDFILEKFGMCITMTQIWGRFDFKIEKIITQKELYVSENQFHVSDKEALKAAIEKCLELIDK